KVDPDRNRHRTGESWTLRTVAAILANPRYTGRQVWNRQHTAADEDSPRWAPKTEWVISKQLAHPPLVSEADFITAQATRTTPTQRQQADLPPGRTAALPRLRAPAGIALGAWPIRLPMPARSHQRQTPRSRPPKDHLPARGRPPRQPPHAHRPHDRQSRARR